MSDFSLKRGATSRSLVAQLRDSNGVVDLTGSTVKFVMRSPDGTVLEVDGNCTITNAASGMVQYEWAAVDVDTAGQYYGEFEVTYPSTKKDYFPSEGYISIAIGDRLRA